MKDAPLMDAKQVAEYLGLDLLTIYAWARKGKLPGIKLGRNWRFRQSDLEAWLDQNSHGPRFSSGAGIRGYRR